MAVLEFSPFAISAEGLVDRAPDQSRDQSSHTRILGLAPRSSESIMQPFPVLKGSTMSEYTVYETVFIQAPTKTQEEQGVGAKIVSGPAPILTIGPTKEVAVAAAAQKVDGLDLGSALIHAVVRVFG